MKNCGTIHSGSGKINRYQLLANAVILQAVKDYRMYYRKLQRNPKCDTAMYEVERLEKFFYGGWFKRLTTIDGKWLVERIKKELENERKSNKRNK